MAENRLQNRIQSTWIRMCSLRLQIDAVFAYKSSLESKKSAFNLAQLQCVPLACVDRGSHVIRCASTDQRHEQAAD